MHFSYLAMPDKTETFEKLKHRQLRLTTRSIPIVSHCSQMLAILFGILTILWAERIGASSVLVADTTMSRMVELNADAPFCALYNDRGVIQRMVLGADPRKVRQISSNLVADLVETCKASRNKGKVRIDCL